MNQISTRTIVAIVAYLGAVTLVGMVEFGDRGYFFSPDAALASDAEDEESVYSLQNLHLLNRSIGYVRSHYVDPERVKPQAMLRGAMEAIQRTVPEVLMVRNVDESNNLVSVTIKVADTEANFDFTNSSDLYQMTWKAKDVMSFLDKSLPASVKRADIEYAAVNGMLRTLDPHSVLLTPSTYDEMRVGTSGKFGGLGIVVSSQNGELTVLTVLPDTPAAKSGMENGDRITQIENESTLNMALDQAVNRLRGEVGKSVTIWVLRKDWQEPKPFRIQREEIRIQAVQHKDLGRGVGYVRVKSFQQNTLSDLKKALQELEDKGAMREGLVFDLRNDPGGLLDQAVGVSDLFLDDGTIVTTVGGSAKIREERKATRQGTLRKVPIVVLVNRGSASASEIVTGALKNNNRAIVLGERTFGKGSVQVLYELEDPRNKTAALKLTIAQYLTPGDKSIQSVGIVPDIYTYAVTLREDAIDLFVSESDRIGESHLDNHLEASGETDDNTELLRFFETPKERDEEGAEPSPNNPYGEIELDYEMRLARDLLVHAGAKTRDEMLEKARKFLDEEEVRQNGRIRNQLASLHVDWSEGPKKANKNPKMKVTLSHDLPDGSLGAGEDLTLTASITNTGTTTLHQMRALSESPYSRLDQLEWVFGAVPAGKTKTWKVTIPMPRNSMARKTPIKALFFQGNDSKEAKSATTEVVVLPLKRPSFAFAYSIRDERGNGDGLVQAGEDVDLLVQIENVGKGDAFKTRAYMKNLSGDQVFLEKGRGKVETLAVGEKALLEYTFHVKKDLDSPFVELEVEITDTVLRTSLITPIQIPIFPNSKVPFVANKVPWKVKTSGKIYSGAADGSPVLSHVLAGDRVQGMGSIGLWTSIQVNASLRGWIHASALAPETQKDIQTQSLPVNWTAVSPQIELSEATKKTGKVFTETMSLSGKALFQKVPLNQKAQVYIFNGDKKIYFEELRAPKDSEEVLVPFNAEIPLNEGSNLLVIYARQNDHIFTRHHVVVYRAEKPSDSLIP